MLLFEPKNRWNLSEDDNPVRAKADSLDLYLKAAQGIIDQNLLASSPPSKFKVILGQMVSNHDKVLAFDIYVTIKYNMLIWWA